MRDNTLKIALEAMNVLQLECMQTVLVISEMLIRVFFCKVKKTTHKLEQYLKP